MGRPSKLTPEQWDELTGRLAAGEKAADLSREYGVSPSSISKRVSKVSQQVAKTAHKLVDAQNSLSDLPLRQQYQAMDLAAKLRSMSESLASAGELGAKTAHRLQSLANEEVRKVDDMQPLASLEALKGVGVLTKLANDSSSIALNLLAANKSAQMQDEDPFEQYSDAQLEAIAGGR